VQWRLLRLLAERHRNLVVVGDPCQTLYGWRGAEVRFLLNFQRDLPDAKVLRLGQNFRSTRRIVDLAEALRRPLGYGAQLWTDSPPGPPARIHVAADERAEATFVAAELQRLVSEGLVEGLGEIAVLYRTRSQSFELARAMRERQIPYRVRGGGDFFEAGAVRDAIAYLRLAHNPADSAALAAIVNTPPRRLGRLVERLRRQTATVAELPNLAAPLGAAAVTGALELVGLVEDLHARASVLRPAALLEIALERSGYRVWLAGQAEGKERLHHLADLSQLIAEAGADLETWLADMALGENASAVEVHDRVHLSTIHRAKGGEWRAVFVVGVEEGLLPHRRALAGGSPAGSGAEDELRAAYVAVTRPRELLYLTRCRARGTGDRVMLRRPSRFLSLLPEEHLERAA
jgi:DNA helicase-2/ATP-dependent DNA helicase PcrA